MFNFPEIIGIYKKEGPTSNDVLTKLKRITDIKKIGHAGTLDPLARGVLVVGITRAGTKRLSEFKDSKKEYLAKIKLGFVSTTDDREGKLEEVDKKIIPTRAEIETILPNFVGDIKQKPPVYSAVRIEGTKAYKLARGGKADEAYRKLGDRDVYIEKIDILSYEYPIIELAVICGPGVYIRALARDIGEELGCGAYLYDLERTRVGEWNKENSLTVEEFKKKYS